MFEKTLQMCIYFFPTENLFVSRKSDGVTLTPPPRPLALFTCLMPTYEWNHTMYYQWEVCEISSILHSIELLTYLLNSVINIDRN